MENNEVLKETALLYFNDALLKQTYEECEELLSFARKFGATQDEINEVITDYVEGRKPRNPKEANIQSRLQAFPPKADQPSAEKEG